MTEDPEAILEEEARGLREDIDRLRAQHERTSRALDRAFAALARLRAVAAHRDDTAGDHSVDPP